MIQCKAVPRYPCILTKDLPGAPTLAIVEEDIPKIAMITDEEGNTTSGGMIGYALAHALMAGLAGAVFYCSNLLAKLGILKEAAVMIAATPTSPPPPAEW